MIHLYNTLTRTIENFSPQNKKEVTMYSCGPTVYDYQHIGHMRRYVGDDILIGVLEYNGYKVNHVMNITDVGHLVSDSDTGEDKMEKGAKKYEKNVWDIAKKFEEQFLKSSDALSIRRPDTLMHATDYIPEQIALIQVLEKKGYTYAIEDGIYFDTAKLTDYYKLSRQNPEGLKAGISVEVVKGKKHVSDFALWKLSPKSEKRQMEWESPWGIGFPGWHIECSAMAMKALGETLDIHTGGIDHIAIHHTNEIAQSEAATGKQFVKYWIHHNFLIIEGEKMSKSLENFYTVQDIIGKGFHPMSLRYLYLQTHYRQEMNFTWESLQAAENAYRHLLREVASWDKPDGRIQEFENSFLEAMNDDLNMPKVLALVWELIKSDHPTAAKAASLAKVDSVLRLNTFQIHNATIPQTIHSLVQKREKLRKAGDYVTSDELRKKLLRLGWEVQDTQEGTQITKI